jgi:acyl carrier protein
MNREETIASIGTILNRVIQDKGEEPHKMREDTRILGGELPVDSLDLAAVVVQLEEMTGCDPFKDGFIEFQTVGELASLYCPPGNA